MNRRELDGVSGGYDRPSVMPDHPADTAAARFEARIVREKRALGISWSNIAKQLGKPETDLRRRHGGLAA